MGAIGSHAAWESEMSAWATFQRRLIAVLLGIDDAVAAALFDGQTDITVSSRAGMAVLDAAAGASHPNHATEQAALRTLAAALGVLDYEHCMHAIERDYERATAALAELAPYIDRARKADVT